MAIPDINCTKCGEEFSFAYMEEIKEHMDKTGHNFFDWEIKGKWYRMILTGNTHKNFPNVAKCVDCVTEDKG